LDLISDINKHIDKNCIIGRNGEILEGDGYEVLSALELAIAASLIYTKT